MSWLVGVEIGGTKLQIALGRGLGEPFHAFWRGAVDAPRGAEPIRRQIVGGVNELLAGAQVDRRDVAGVGIGFGGPVDTRAGRTVLSNQVAGWEDFPLIEWFTTAFGWPAVLQNDADTAALAEASFGAGRGFDPVLYVTVGSGIGGGLISGGKIYRGNGAGAMEVGHLRLPPGARGAAPGGDTVESIAAGFGIEDRARRMLAEFDSAQRDKIQSLLTLAGGDWRRVTTKLIAQAAAAGDGFSQSLLAEATDTLGWGLAQAITLVNPARIVIGGGVSLIGEALFFEPVRRACRRQTFLPFVDLAEIVPAALGEDVVVHGALALAQGALGAS